MDNYQRNLNNKQNNKIKILEIKPILNLLKMILNKYKLTMNLHL